MNNEIFPIRQEIVVSWFRSAFSGVHGDRFEVPYDSDIHVTSRLVRAAGPVLERLADDLATTPNSLLLSDHRGQILVRHVDVPSLAKWLDNISLAPGFFYSESQVGTNAVGSALVVQRPFVVQGPEHFSDALATMGGAAAPIADPWSGDPLGALGLHCRAADASPLMLPLVKRAAAEIEQRLLEGTPASDALLKEHFSQVQRRTRSALVCLSDSKILANAMATRELLPGDHHRLWNALEPSIVASQPVPPEVSLGAGSWRIKTVEPVRDSNVLIGVSVVLVPPSRQPLNASDARAQRSPVDRCRFGWGSLTATEWRVADLVADGMTNRQVAAEIYLSPHTVSFHLRAIFRKLEVASRVELTRLLIDRSASQSSPPPEDRRDRQMSHHGGDAKPPPGGVLGSCRPRPGDHQIRR